MDVPLSFYHVPTFDTDISFPLFIRKEERVRRIFIVLFFFSFFLVDRWRNSVSGFRLISTDKKFADEKSRLPKKPRYPHFDPLILRHFLCITAIKKRATIILYNCRESYCFDHSCCAINKGEIILPFRETGKNIKEEGARFFCKKKKINKICRIT